MEFCNSCTLKPYNIAVDQSEVRKMCNDIAAGDDSDDDSAACVE